MRTRALLAGVFGTLALAGCKTDALSEPPRATVSVKSLRWNLEPSGERVGPTSVTWLHAGRKVWTRPIPAGLRFTIVDDVGARAWLKRQRRADGYTKYWAVAELDGAIALAAEGDLIVFEVADGSTRFSWTDARDRDERGDTYSEALLDIGDVEITAPTGTRCELHVSYTQSFIRACDDALIYFDRGILAIFDLGTGDMIAKTPWRGPSSDELSGRCPGIQRASVDQTKTLDGWSIRAHGERQTLCQT